MTQIDLMSKDKDDATPARRRCPGHDPEATRRGSHEDVTLDRHDHAHSTSFHLATGHAAEDIAWALHCEALITDASGTARPKADSRIAAASAVLRWRSACVASNGDVRCAHHRIASHRMSRAGALRACPIHWQTRIADMAVERGMRPVGDIVDQAMLHGIAMDVIDAVPQITLVADETFPIAALPDAAFAPPKARCRDVLVREHRACEGLLDQHPAEREVMVAIRHRPDGMQTVRHRDPRDDLERMPVPNGTRHIAQHVEMLRQQSPRTIREIDGERIRATRHPQASIVRHARSMPTTPAAAHPATLPHPVRKPRHPITPRNPAGWR